MKVASRSYPKFRKRRKRPEIKTTFFNEKLSGNPKNTENPRFPLGKKSKLIQFFQKLPKFYLNWTFLKAYVSEFVTGNPDFSTKLSILIRNLLDFAR